MPSADTVTFTAPCPPCGNEATWTSTRQNSDINRTDGPPGVEVRCPGCD